ncbi:MAG: hypothetical protein Q9213_002821 [Squamulea squamosa]
MIDKVLDFQPAIVTTGRGFEFLIGMVCLRPLLSVKLPVLPLPLPRSIVTRRAHRSPTCSPRSAIHLRPHRIPNSQRRSASTTAAVAAFIKSARDARSFVTRFKNFVLGTTLGLTIILGYFYITDTRSSIHEWLVIPCLRYVYPDPEDAHEFGNKALKTLGSFGLQPRERNLDIEGDLFVEIFGNTLLNPVGTSAGIDKHCDIPDVLLNAGPAVIEIGGVTPEPQEGNAKPRVWRLPSQKALINRYGLNSEGADHIAMRLRQRLREYAYHIWGIDEEAEQKILDGAAGVPPGSLQHGKLLAVQIAKNKWTPDEDIQAVKRDYVYCVETLAKYADIIVVNVSSPNTPGLRELQKVEPLTDILTAVVGAARKVKRKIPVNVLVKVSPDQDTEADVRGICDAVWESGVGGVVVGNTTNKRPDPLPTGLPEHERRLLQEQGGYSGPQTFGRTVALVKRYRTMLDEAAYSNMDNEAPPSPIAKSSSFLEPPSKVEPPTNPGSSARNEPSTTSSIAASAKSLLLETHEETHPPITDSEVEASVARDKQHLKPETPEADADSKSQPIIRLPERSNPFSSFSSTNNGSSSSPSSQETRGVAASSSTDAISPPSTSSTLSSSSSPNHSQRKVIFATGGITNGAQVLEVLAAGADVAQVYTALVYSGIGTITKIKEQMREELAKKKREAEK